MKDWRNSFRALPGLLALLTLAVWGSASAASRDTPLGGEAGIMIGALLADQDLAGESGQVDLSIGGRGASVFTRRLSWFADGLFSIVDTNSSLGDAREYYGRTGLEWLFIKKPRSSWFINGAFGWLKVDYENGTVEDFHRPLISAGFGQLYPVGGRKHLRWELRADVTVDNRPGLNGATMQQGLALVGLIWGPSGGSARLDEDGDRVRNSRDRCPQTPAGASVDRHGCPLDSDRDGVPDGIDRCSSTLPGGLVDDAGCPRDSDGDRVLDGADACPDTPEGLPVDEWGCPRDRDRDGVPDGLDRCPRTPLGIGVDDKGCPMDSDGDGVLDGLDRCPQTPADTHVDAKGCTVSPFLWVPDRLTLIVWLDFEVNSASLDDAARALLDEVISVVQQSSYRFEIGVHIDAKIGESDPDRLSDKRAAAVRRYLVEQGVAAERLEARGYGTTEPLAETGPARESNDERVEFKRIE